MNKDLIYKYVAEYVLLIIQRITNIKIKYMHAKCINKHKRDNFIVYFRTLELSMGRIIQCLCPHEKITIKSILKILPLKM